MGSNDIYIDFCSLLRFVASVKMQTLAWVSRKTHFAPAYMDMVTSYLERFLDV